MSDNFNKLTDVMRFGVPVSRKTLQQTMGGTRKQTNRYIEKALVAGTICRATPMEVGSGKHSIPEPTQEPTHEDLMKMKYERKKSYEKRRPRKFNVFVLV